MKISQVSGRLVLILVPVFLLVLILIDGVNVPFWDEWSTPGEFLNIEKLTFADFFRQSNESRLIVPKLIFLGVSKFVGWQPKHYMVLGWLIIVAILWLTYKVCYRRPARGGVQDGVGLLCLAFSSALLFSPAQYENWLWGLQWVIFVPLLCALIAYDLQRRTRSFGVRLIITVLLNLVGMFSFSNGMILWIVSFPFWREALEPLAGRRPSKREVFRWLAWTSAYCLAAVIFVRIYFTDYQNVFAEPPLAFVLREPSTVVQYFAAWCGGPIHSNGVMHIVTGFALLLAMLVSLAWLTYRIRTQSLSKNRRYLGMLYPAILIMVYALGSGMMTTLGRASFGVDQAYSSRYLFHSGTLWVGFVAALNTCRLLAARRQQQPGYFRGVLVGALVVFSILLARTWNHFYKQFDLWRMGRLQTLLTVRMLSYSPKSPMVARTCRWLDLPPIVQALAAKHLYDPSLYGDWLADAVKHPHPVGGGQFRVLPSPAREIAITGWAISPEKVKPADSVLVCRRNKEGQPEPFIMLAVGYRNNEVIRDTGKASLGRSGFFETFPWPETEDFATAALFAVDEQNKALHPISRTP